MRSSDLQQFATAVPLAAIAAHGLGPLHANANDPTAALHELREGHLGIAIARDSAGTIGGQLLSVLAMFGGEAPPSLISRETATADAAQIAEELARLSAAGLTETAADGTVWLPDVVLDHVHIHIRSVSMADLHAITSDALDLICKIVGVTPTSLKKHDRIVALTTFFASEKGRSMLVGLSADARELLDKIADVAGPFIADAGWFGYSYHQLESVTAPRFAFESGPSDPLMRPLYELAQYGIVGVGSYDEELWIWPEAWPVLDRPIYAAWPTMSAPACAQVEAKNVRLPEFMSLAEGALRRWSDHPPRLLKNRERRFAKTEIRATAKELGTTEQVVELLSRLLLGLGLLLPNVVSDTGRGRNRKLDHAWMPDPELLAAWRNAPVQQRWLRMFAEWARPADFSTSQQRLANRQLLMWELALLEIDTGWTNADDIAAWLGHRYAPIGHNDYFLESLHDLRVLGIVTEAAPYGLTALGSLALDNPDALADVSFGDSTQAIVQPDLTIVAPPDLDPQVAARIAEIAVLVSSAGAVVYRLDEDLLAKAALAGSAAETICAFLDELSSVPVDAAVKRFVADAAARAGRIKVMPAITIVVTNDPVDLATAVSSKAAKLTQIAPTVAVSELSPEKVRAALDRRGLMPQLVGGVADTVTARKASDQAEELERRAKQQRTFAERSGRTFLAAHADDLEAEAELARSPDKRLKVDGFLSVSASVIERLGSADRS